MKKTFFDSLNPEEKKLYEKIRSANEEQKDRVLMMLILNMGKTVTLLEKIVSWVSMIEKAKSKELSQQVKTEIKEIEHTLSVGIPGWLKYTIKNKRAKK